MKTGIALPKLAYELQRQQELKKDYLIGTEKLSLCARDGNIVMHALLPDGITEFGINENAHKQISQRLSIPAAYYTLMRTEIPELLSYNVNTWFTERPDLRMLRTLGGTARAFLSTKYRRIDNIDILEAVYPIIEQINGGEVESCEITDTRMYIKVLNPQLKTEVSPGDVVQAGIVISNSEIGLGSVSISPLIYRLVCKNGMIAQDNSLRKNHVGRINESDANYILYRDETLEADDRAFLMKVQDTVRTVVDEISFERIVDKLRGAKTRKFDPLDASRVVELTAKQYNINKEESGGVLAHLLRGNESSMYGLANAFTRYSQDISDYDRATEFESLGWQIITDAPVLHNSFRTSVAA